MVIIELNKPRATHMKYIVGGGGNEEFSKSKTTNSQPENSLSLPKLCHLPHSQLVLSAATCMLFSLPQQCVYIG